MQRKVVLAGLLAVLAATPASAATGDMSVAAFLARVNALKARGMAAMFSPDIGALKSETMAAGMAYVQRLRQEMAAGTPSSCPPQKPDIDRTMWISHLETYPAAQRDGVSIKRAMADMFMKTWPCRR